jgi:hypothetical protein
MEMGFTDDCYTDGREPSVTPSVLLLPTECINVTDGISPSAKLYNVVVNRGVVTCTTTFNNFTDDILC